MSLPQRSNTSAYRLEHILNPLPRSSSPPWQESAVEQPFTQPTPIPNVRGPSSTARATPHSSHPRAPSSTSRTVPAPQYLPTLLPASPSTSQYTPAISSVPAGSHKQPVASKSPRRRAMPTVKIRQLIEQLSLDPYVKSFDADKVICAACESVIPSTYDWQTEQSWRQHKETCHIIRVWKDPYSATKPTKGMEMNLEHSRTISKAQALEKVRRDEWAEEIARDRQGTYGV